MGYAKRMLSFAADSNRIITRAALVKSLSLNERIVSPDLS